MLEKIMEIMDAHKNPHKNHGRKNHGRPLFEIRNNGEIMDVPEIPQNFPPVLLSTFCVVELHRQPWFLRGKVDAASTSFPGIFT
jgi:hypothetical protein